ncbi:sulfurtransferase [Neisseriaceae bacterium TC5R-5]|nr:sulfurtransferase [Neisseriaceae bacterium TC5R-5]
MYQTLITPTQLRALPIEHLVILDCRFQLEQADYGRAAYDAGHIPHAHYLHLDYHLSGSKTGSNGRHPLPDSSRFATDMGAIGISTDTQVVVYDDAAGQYAARAWWLLRWLGHSAVAVLDGGFAAWLAAGGESCSDAAQRHPCRFGYHPALTTTVSVDEVMANLNKPEFTVVDARSAERYHGQGETLDPVAGHIPGALNRFFMQNLQADKRFKSAEVLRAEWQQLLGEEMAPDNIVHQCGSGVTACHNLLAMEHAGLTGSRLYPGSWSEWCSDAERPVERSESRC